MAIMATIETAPFLPPTLTCPMDATDGAGGILPAAMVSDWEIAAHNNYVQFYVRGLVRKYPDADVNSLLAATIKAARGRVSPVFVDGVIRHALGEIDRPYTHNGKPVTFRDFQARLREGAFLRFEEEVSAREDLTPSARQHQIADMKQRYLAAERVASEGIGDLDTVMTYRKRPE